MTAPKSISKTGFRRSRREKRNRFRLRQVSKERLRLSVFRSNRQIYAQLIDDASGKTLIAASSLEKSMPKETRLTCETAKNIGRILGERARAQGVEKAVFDRGLYKFHGRIKALAEGARSAGLEV